MVDIAELVTERTRQHGDFRDHARVSQALKRAVHREPAWQTLTDMHREAIDMILHKVGRIVAGDPNHRDHWDDIGGYAKITADRLEKSNG